MGVGMNLIEKLGYEEAKKQFDELKKHKELYSGEFARNDAMLLEYRRQHGIFEKGDKVVYLNEPILRSVTEVRTVKWVSGKSLWVYSKDRYDFATEVYFNQIRHAADSEIAAGHRID